jgi:MFS family permease
MFSRLAPPAPIRRVPFTDETYVPYLVPAATTHQRRISPRNDLRAGMGDGATFSLMVGLGETYLVAFALALGTGEIVAGLIATVPMLAGALLQMATPWAVHRLGSHKRWVVACACCQAVSLLVVPVAALVLEHAASLIFLTATMYWAAGLATGPAWNTWMETIVPKRVRTRYFAQRVRICQVFTLVGFAAGGLLLEAGKGRGWTVMAFTTLFLAAAASRFLSAMYLSRQSEPGAGEKTNGHAGLLDVLGRLRGHSGAKLLVYLIAVQISVQMAGPYFVPYMLMELELTYLQFMLLIGTGFIGKVLTLPLWGKLAHYWGARRLLWIGGVTIIPLGAGWIVSQNFYYLMALQFVAGVLWAAYELAMLLMFFETIPRHQRTSLLTIYNVGNALAIVIGSLLGAALLRTLGVGQGAPVLLLGLSPYLVLYGLSSVGRLFTLPLMLRVPEIHFEPTTPAIRMLTVRPADGAADPPILPSIPDQAG